MTFREELIQVAAVAVAIIEDIDHGEASVGTDTTGPVLLEVFRERHGQDAKWGPQTHSENDWIMILMEEVGEAAEEVENRTSLLGVIINTGRGAKRYLKQKFGM